MQLTELATSWLAFKMTNIRYIAENTSTPTQERGQMRSVVYRGTVSHQSAIRQ